MEHKEIETYPLFLSSLLLSLTGCQGSHAVIDASSSHLHNSLGWEQWECPSTSMHTLVSLFRPAWHTAAACPHPLTVLGFVSFLYFGDSLVLPARGSCRRQLVWGMPALMAALSVSVFLWKRRDSGIKIILFCPFPVPVVCWLSGNICFVA